MPTRKRWERLRRGFASLTQTYGGFKTRAGEGSGGVVFPRRRGDEDGKRNGGRRLVAERCRRRTPWRRQAERHQSSASTRRLGGKEKRIVRPSSEKKVALSGTA
ncbi:hypothetical protein NDU88_001042 [Pleurodeles waltl]|uniref:Uncharacterized protein n=1 Tax=Pleurodeles waltl TaxID=8319 RepID=A0AAV7UTM9_PLEWA|nr:hypothetical protein NDU88_001042 [Pleurodeles waltl]